MRILGLLFAAAGGLLLYSGLVGRSPQDELRSVLDFISHNHGPVAPSFPPTLLQLAGSPRGGGGSGQAEDAA